LVLIDLVRAQTGNSPYDACLLAYVNRDYKQAVVHATEAIRIQPGDSWAFHARSLSLLALGDLDNALADATSAIKKAPPHARLFVGRAWVYYYQHHWKEMLEDANAALDLDSKSPYYLTTRAIALCGLKRFVPALEDIKKAVLLDGTYSRAFALRAYVHAYHLRYKEAVSDYELAIKHDKDNTYAMSRFARLLATCPEGEIRDGLKSLELAKRSCEMTHWEEWGCLSALAAAYAELGMFEKAIEFEEKAQKICSNKTALEIGRSNLNGFREGRAIRENPWGSP